MNRLSRARKEQSGLSTFHLQRLEIWKGLELLGRERGLGGGGGGGLRNQWLQQSKENEHFAPGVRINFLATCEIVHAPLSPHLGLLKEIFFPTWSNFFP